MRQVLRRKLESFAPLSDEARWALNGLTLKIRQVGAREDLVREGDKPESVLLILDGYACRYKMLPDGRRQIMALLVPGDLCNLNVFILDRMDHTIATISASQIVEIPRQAIDEIATDHADIARALWWCSLVDGAVMREWLVNIGGRLPPQRIAHLLCELLMRLETVGRVTDNSFAFPLRQTQIADAMGLSDVHVNRTLQELRALGLIHIRRRVLTILDVKRLQAFCNFTPNYLHIRNTG